MLNGQLFLTAAGGLDGGYDEATLRKLAIVAHQQSVNRVLVEANFGDGMFTQLLKPVMSRIHPVTIEEVKHTKQKELRIIDTLEPVLMQHRLVVDERLIRLDFETCGDIKKSLFYQLTRITRDRGALVHDDRLDALAGAVNYWTEQMARDVDKAVQKHRDKVLDAELKRLKKHVFGVKSRLSGPRWFRV